MKKARGVLLLAAAIAVGAPAWGHWTAFGEDDSKAVWYVDAESVRAAGAYKEIWAMKDMVEPEVDFDLSKQFLVEVDCQGRRQRLLQYQSYRGRMGSGEPTRGGLVFGEWAAAGPGTVGSNLLKVACPRS